MRLTLYAIMAFAAAQGATFGGGWESALARMPLPLGVRHLSRTNCVEVMLGSFRSNDCIKGMIFMPGATDEFYMFRRAHAALTNATPNLLDAVVALTNQSHIRATLRSPFLLLHTAEDPLEPLMVVEHPATADRLKEMRFLPHALYNDRDWDGLQPVLKKALKVDVRPWRWSYDSWHFYRHSFVGWGLTGWEVMEAATLAGKSRLTVGRKLVEFEGDERIWGTPAPVAPSPE